MKTILTIAFIAFLTITTSAVATNVHPTYTQGTTSSCFSYFRVHRQMNGAGLMWAVNQQGVTGFTIERAYDYSEDYEVVTSLTAHAGAQYRYTDREALPGYVTYRIKATLDNGTTSISQVQTIRIVSRK